MIEIEKWTQEWDENKPNNEEKRELLLNFLKSVSDAFKEKYGSDAVSRGWRMNQWPGMTSEIFFETGDIKVIERPLVTGYAVSENHSYAGYTIRLDFVGTLQSQRLDEILKSLKGNDTKEIQVSPNGCGRRELKYFQLVNECLPIFYRAIDKKDKIGRSFDESTEWTDNESYREIEVMEFYQSIGIDNKLLREAGEMIVTEKVKIQENERHTLYL